MKKERVNLISRDGCSQSTRVKGVKMTLGAKESAIPGLCCHCLRDVR